MKYFSPYKQPARIIEPTTYVLNFNETEVTRETEQGTEKGYEYDTIRIEKSNLDYPHIVSAIIRTRYTSDQVEAIVLNHGDGNPDHEVEYTALQQWRTEAKQIARQVLAHK